jgi:predicted GNAT superfamily acetyltransferase
MNQSSTIYTPGVAVRRLRDLAEMESCVRLQQLIWHYSDLDVIPNRVFLVAEHCNAQVLGAFDGERIIGFSLAFLASRDGKLYLHSHMAGMHPAYQNGGVGRMLKLAQRADALDRGINRIEWTFDPLQSRNAYFNLVRLGAIVRTYIPNFYGNTSSPLHGGLPTDRVVAEWDLDSPHTIARIENRFVPPSGSHRVGISSHVTDIAKTDPASAVVLQRQLREGLEQGFTRGLAATGVKVENEKFEYLMEPYED